MERRATEEPTNTSGRAVRGDPFLRASFVALGNAAGVRDRAPFAALLFSVMLRSHCTTEYLGKP